MHTIENEFDQCVAAIRRQKGCEFKLFFIEHMPHRDAHQALYNTFMKNASTFDLFVKVDADMVISRDDFFEKLISRFQAAPEMDKLTVAVQDFFPNRLVEGLHSWRNNVRWPVIGDNVFVDSDPVILGTSVTDYLDLAPCAVHCPDPSPFQSFHYGLIRAVKVMVGLRREWLNTWCLGLVDDTWKHLLRNPDRNLALACVGAELALKGDFGEEDLDYDCARTISCCERMKALQLNELIRKARRLRPLNRLRHPALLFKAVTFREWIRRLTFERSPAGPSPA